MDPTYTAEYEQFELRHWWFVVRRRIIIDALDRYATPAGNTRWLDVGCGSGVLLDAYARIASTSKVGVEMDVASVERARSKGLEVHAASADWDYASLGQFDLITMCDVLEHIEHENVALDEVHRRLNPGGTLLLTVPALMSLWSEHDEINHHFRRYRRRELISRFDPSRWRIEKCSYFCSLLLPMVWTVRKLKNLRRRTGGRPGGDFKFGNLLVDGTLRSIFSIERPLLRGINLPLGSSLLLVARRL